MRSAARLLMAAAVCLFVLAGVAPASGASEAAPGLQQARIDVTMSSDGTARTEATYRLSGPAGGTPIPHRLLPRGGSEVVDLQLRGSGAIPAANATTYEVPVRGSSYTLVSTSRSDDPADGDVPLPVPDIPTAADADVQITVTLPDGQQLVGDSLPSFSSATSDGRPVLNHTGSAVPSAVVAPYGSGGMLTVGDVLTVAGLLVLALTCVLWFRDAHRKHHPEPAAAAASSQSDDRPTVAASTTSRSGS